jgi:polygalacturonase
MRSFIFLASAILPIVLACESPDTHPCAASFVNNPASASAFCATYTKSVVTAVTGVPALFSAPCLGKASSISSACTCFAPNAVATPVPVSTTLTTSVKTTPATTPAPVTKTTSVVQPTGGAGGTAITSLAGGSGVGGTTCTVTNIAQVSASAAACSNILLSGVSVPASSTLSVKIPTSGALLFAGTMTVAYTPDAAYTPIVLQGSHAKIVGLPGAVIDGNGAKYWDGEGSNGGTAKPDHFIKISDMVSSSFSEIKVQNWPTHLFEITGSTDFTVSNVILDNSAGAALGHNTDAFDVSSTNGLLVSGATVYNQDDCVAVNSGSNMVFENMYCDGSHGLSIGSISSGVTVSNVTFKDSTVINGQNACRIKTDAGDSGSTVSDITYSNIFVSGITTYAIDVQQDYENGSPTGDPTTGIQVTGVTFSDITGSVSSSAYEYYILCGSTSSCSDFTWSGISITGGKTACVPAGSLCP